MSLISLFLKSLPNHPEYKESWIQPNSDSMAAASTPLSVLFEAKYMRLVVRVVVLGSSTKVRLSPQNPPKMSETNIKTPAPEAPLPPGGSQQRGALGGVVHSGEVSAVHVPVLPPRLVGGRWDAGVPVVHVVGHEQGQLQNLGPDQSSINPLKCCLLPCRCVRLTHLWFRHRKHQLLHAPPPDTRLSLLAGDHHEVVTATAKGDHTLVGIREQRVLGSEDIM